MANSNPRLGCSEDSECGNGKQCVDNICITKYSRRVVCDPPCNPPYTCIQGKFQKHCVLRPKSIKSQGMFRIRNTILKWYKGIDKVIIILSFSLLTSTIILLFYSYSCHKVFRWWRMTKIIQLKWLWIWIKME